MNNKLQRQTAKLPLFLAALLAGVGGWLAFSPASVPRPAVQGADADTVISLSVPTRTLTRPIEQIHVGDRVLAANPDRSELDPAEPEPDATWQAVEVFQRKPGGGQLFATLLRPQDWIDEHVRGRRVELDRPELGAAGPAEVLSVSAAPTIMPGSGQVVTGTFRHQAGGELVRVRVAGEVVVCTDGHRFWSETTQAFVPAKNLKAGDLVRTRTAGLATVDAVEAAGGAGWVYNLEVTREHVYEVGVNGILVHNDNCTAYRSLSPEDILNIASGKGVLPRGTAGTNNALHGYITQNKDTAFVASFDKFKLLKDKSNYIEFSTKVPGYRSAENLRGDKGLMKLFIGDRDKQRFSDGHSVVKGGIPNGHIKKLVVDGKEVDVKDASALAALLQSLQGN
jgi:hypothetical protein